MSNSVYANAMGLFHKGSGGQGIAPGDVCLSPPPPPAGPVPVPYVNMLSASDLTKGSKSVKVQGNPTALEDTSEIASSTGDASARAMRTRSPKTRRHVSKNAQLPCANFGNSPTTWRRR